MKVPMKWLSRYVDTAGYTADDIAAMLTNRGLEIASVDKQGEDIDKVVVGRIDKLVPHPDSDHMLICTMNVGAMEPLQIVTGAQNVKEGDYVPVALHGSTLPGGVKIKKGKLRGVESYGMLCSGEELRLTDHDYPGAEVNGIIILNEEWPLGTDVHAVFGLDDVVLDAEPTPNRPDLQSVIGVAREVACAIDRPLVLPKPVVKAEGDRAVTDYVKVEVEDSELCPRYMARTVRNINIAPSPKWMSDALRAAGIRAINNIVDITNYVMLEYGQPMHAFDLSCVDDNHIVVRCARAGEKMVTLDNKERDIDESTLMICDAKRPVGIAGVMGGMNSEITSSTETVLFESAKFEGKSIRLTSKKMGMMTEASQRFVKGVDIEGVETALERACQLVEELNAGVVDKGVVDVCPASLERRVIIARPDKVNALVALDVPKDEMARILNALYIPTEINADGNLRIEIPHFRDDIIEEADISEEVARIVGYDAIPLTLMNGDLVRGRLTKAQEHVDAIRNALVSMGAYEAMTFSFTGSSAFDKLLLPADSYLRNAVKLVNPFGEDNSMMRTNLAASLLPAVALNLNRKVSSLRLYEIANVHFPTEDKHVIPDERKVLCVTACGPDEDFYSIKGMVEMLCSALAVENISFSAGGDAYYHPGRKAVLLVDGKAVGQLGEVHPDVCENFDISTRVYMAEIEIAGLLAGVDEHIKYKTLPKYPSVERDIAIVVANEVQAGDVMYTIKKNAGKLLESVALFDVYAGSNIQDGKKSLAYSLSFRADDRTLTDEDVLRAMDKVMKALSNEYSAEQRR